MRSIIEALKAKVLRVVIHDIHENTFYAKIVMEYGGKNLEIDARPSDSIALALRTKAPIFVSERIILEETVIEPQAENQDIKKFKKYIDNLKPADFLKDGFPTVNDEENISASESDEDDEGLAGI